MEIWNAYTADGAVVADTVLERGKPIPDGLYHLVVECIITHNDASILFMKRDSTKPSYPNYYEATAGGSALWGENAETAILREIFEETGLSLTNSQLIHYQHHIAQDAQCLFDRYWARIDCHKDAICLQAGETTDFVWVEKEKLADFMEQNPIVPWQKKAVQQLFLEIKKQDSE